jgi:hypothetical protein
MTQLVKQSKAPGLTPTALFQQWWDTQNPGDQARTNGPHCDDDQDPLRGSVINDFPYACRPAPAEGKQAACDPFSGDPACTYIPVGLFSRFDLADAEGASCGEYRIVFAKTTGQTNARDRNLLIFEAAMPNPYPWAGLRGCRPIVGFWSGLSRIDKADKRGKELERFYFKGLGYGIPPAVHISHYGDNTLGLGQVRTNQFVQDGLEQRAWSLREFELQHDCTTSFLPPDGTRPSKKPYRPEEVCSLTFVPDTNKVNPFGPLFADDPTHRQQAAFQEFFLSQVQTLAAEELSAIAMQVEDRFNSAQSEASGSTETDYLASFVEGGAFATSIDAELSRLQIALEPANIVARAQTQSCAGCHRLSNNEDLGGGLTWPASAGFTHVDERALEKVGGESRFVISPALITTFLPARKAVMEDFMRGKPRTLPNYALLGGHSPR